jgi:hypothetical protein
MRLFIALCVAVVVVLPAAAAELDPKTLVLQQADVPARFQLDRAQSGVRTNANAGEDAKFLARSGRITGYVAQYVQRQPSRGVQSRVDLFRRPAGARLMFARANEKWRRFTQGEPRQRGRIGTESWIYGGFVDTVVIWRYGRAYAFVLGLGMTKERTLTLARKQQSRIAAALR